MFTNCPYDRGVRGYRDNIPIEVVSDKLVECVMLTVSSIGAICG